MNFKSEFESRERVAV